MLRTTLLTVAGLAAAANAGIFSFASDTSDQSWTFLIQGHGGHYAITDGTHFTDPTILLIDDDNGILDPLSYSVDFNLHADIDYQGSTPIGGGKYLHSYRVEDAVAGWYLDTGPVLEMTFDDSIITIVGDEFGWDSAGSMFGADSWAGVQYTSYINAPEYDMYEGQAVGPQDFGFSITALNTSGALPWDHSEIGASLDPNTMMPLEDVYTEGSFSGSARFVPAPGTAAVLLLAGLAGTRRRR
jgi:hypothetical protein